MKKSYIPMIERKNFFLWKTRVKNMQLLLILLTSFLFIPKTSAQVESKRTNSYDVLNLNTFPVGMWVTPPDQFRNDVQFKRIAKAGVNFVNGFSFHENSLDEIKATLDLCAKYDLKYFVNRSNAHETILSYSKEPKQSILDNFMTGVKDYIEHPAYAGELLFDEPGKPLFTSLSAFTKQFEKFYPYKMWHVNLFPSYATGGIQCDSYEDYITSWLDQVSPGYISFDSYPLLQKGGIIQDYFYNLDLIRAKTVEKKIPFWTFIQTLSIAQTPGVTDKRDPSEEEIRWQVWINLVFGAKGIQYFCYWTPGSGSEVFGNALITQEGKKTNKYNYVKRINSDINRTGEILLNCDAEGIIQTAETPYQLYMESLNNFGPIKGVSGEDNMIGCFIDPDGLHYALISPLTPNKGATVRLKIGDGVESVIVIKGGKTTRVNIKNKELIQKISPGDAVLIAF